MEAVPHQLIRQLSNRDHWSGGRVIGGDGFFKPEQINPPAVFIARLLLDPHQPEAHGLMQGR